MLKHTLTGTGLAIGVTLLSASQVLAADFIIDTFNNQFTGPCTPTSAFCTTNQTQANPNNPVLQTGTTFSNAVPPTGTPTSPAFIRDPSGLPPNQVIGGSRDLEFYSLLNPNGATSSGTSRVVPTGTGVWQITSTVGSQVSSSMIWNNINPLLPPTASNSGQFANRLRRGALGFQTAGLSQPPSDPTFQNVFTFVLRDTFNNESRVSRRGITSNQFVFITFEEFRAASNFLLDLNEIKYVELNVVTGGQGSSTVRVDLVRGFEIPEPSLVLGLGVVFCVGYLSTKGSRVQMRENKDSL
jgi:hypothetical protein